MRCAENQVRREAIAAARLARHAECMLAAVKELLKALEEEFSATPLQLASMV